MRKIALFGGSFDPPHLGHQLVISYVMGAGEVDELWAIPAYKHALGKNLTDYEHRYQMVSRMCSIFSKNVLASRAEESVMYRTKNYVDSRTINLVRFLYKMNPQCAFRLVIGSDLIDQAKTWDEWEDIEKIAPPLVVGRLGYGDAPFMLPNISSSDIKAHIKDGSLSKLVPKAVADYIMKVGLYRDELEEAFHITRRMFVLRGDELFVAPKGDSRSHAQWFEDMGWHGALDYCTRGFWDNRGVFLYVGRRWEFNAQVQEEAPIIVELLKERGVPAGLKVFGGMVPGAPGTLWPPICRLEYTT